MPIYRTWVAQPTNTTCARCLALDGVRVLAGQQFPGDGGDGPPLHRSCECIVHELEIPDGVDPETYFSEPYESYEVTRDGATVSRTDGRYRTDGAGRGAKLAKPYRVIFTADENRQLDEATARRDQREIDRILAAGRERADGQRTDELIDLARRIDSLVESRRYAEIPKLAPAERNGMIAMLGLTDDELAKSAKDLASDVYLATRVARVVGGDAKHDCTCAAPAANERKEPPMPSKRDQAIADEREAMLKMIQDASDEWHRRTIEPLRPDVAADNRRASAKQLHERQSLDQARMKRARKAR